MLMIVFLMALAGWLIGARAYYRHCMQQELLAVLAAATRGGLPLHAAIKAFAVDRPEGWLHRAWAQAGLGMVLPGLNLWYRWWNYRRRLFRLADALQRGGRLTEALRFRRKLVSRETALAVSVGEESGRLSETLEEAHLLGSRFGTLWIRLAVHLVYPLVLAWFGSTVLWMQWQFLWPQMSGIMTDFELEMPRIAYATEPVTIVLSALLTALLALVVIIGLAQVSSTIRWYLPGIAWYYRGRTRAQVLQMLSVLLQVDRPLPQALHVLAKAPLGGQVRGRLARAARLASQGRSPAECLRKTRLAPRNWVALLESAQQRGHLPWAMRELADNLYRQLQRRFQRVINVGCPLLVAIIGSLFAFGCFAMFYPLVYMIDLTSSIEWVY